MKLKVKVSPEGSTYVAAIDPESGEHRKAATLNPGQEFEIDIPGATSVDDVAFSDVLDSEAEQPGGGNEGSSQGGETEEPQPPAGSGEQPPADGGTPDASGGDQGGGEQPAPTTSEASEKPLYVISGEEIPGDFAPSGLETPGGETLYHFAGDAAGEPGTGNGDAISIYADADDNERPVQAAAPAENEAGTS